MYSYGSDLLMSTGHIKTSPTAGLSHQHFDTSLGSTTFEPMLLATPAVHRRSASDHFSSLTYEHVSADSNPMFETSQLDGANHFPDIRQICWTNEMTSNRPGNADYPDIDFTHADLIPSLNNPLDLMTHNMAEPQLQHWEDFDGETGLWPQQIASVQTGARLSSFGYSG